MSRIAGDAKAAAKRIFDILDHVSTCRSRRNW
jgi:hypothetical protein